ncbi:FAD dependent oxidoreductase family protein [Stipitochalara longipes BDJ]|nr:FAD dependent oxidoreductase family protein [Stipitochalara longipes BDJ]
MRVFRTSFSLLAVLASLSVASTSISYAVNGNKYNVDEVITRDVTILGGGSGGTYSAVRLNDLGKSVAVVEASGRLGGNTETYTDPGTGTTIEIGVEFFHNFTVVTDYFARLGVALTTAEAGPNTNASVVNTYVDFLTSQPDPSYVFPDFTAALGAYAAQLIQYPYLDFGFDLPSPVPSDLLLPFDQFITKYSLDALVPFVWIWCQGIGDLLNTPTIYVMKYLGLSSLQSLETGFLTTALHDNSLLYLSAETILGGNVLYNSTVLAVKRTDDYVQTVIQQGSKITLIQSSQLIVAIPPTVENMEVFDSTHQENRLFKQFTYSEYFTALLRNTGIPDTVRLSNVSPGVSFSLAPPPCIYAIDQTGVSGLVAVTYISTAPTQGDEIADLVVQQIKSVEFEGKADVEEEALYAVKSNHRPFELVVDADAIKSGFYKDLYSLQGEKRTWWTGAAWHAHDSSLIWRFTEGLLGNITEAV